MSEILNTLKLYDDAPYDTEFTAMVVEIKDPGEGCCLIILDRTLFFPEEGGQTCDKGMLGGFEVQHVSIDRGIITHRVKCSPAELKQGDEVRGVIDWDHRFSNMQNHTAEHILSGLLHKIWKSENVGFHLSDNIVTLDTSKELDGSDLKQLEIKANEAVYNNLPVTCAYYAPSELQGMEYRSKIELHEDVRLVTIKDVDVCACCAPHVSRTGEIGIIKIIKAIRYKGGMRLTFLAGRRAYEHFSDLQDRADAISHLLSESPEKLEEAVVRLLKQNEECRIKIKNAAAARLEQEIASLPDDTGDAVLFTDTIDNTVQRNAVNSLSERYQGICAVFASDGDNGFNYILSYPCGDARDISKLLKEHFSAKGGGSKEMVQGNVKASKTQIIEAMEIRE